MNPELLLVLLLGCAFTTFAVDPLSVQNSEIRGFLGIVVPNSPKQGPTGDFRSIASVMPGSPAEAAGTKAGDYILAVDGKSTADLKSNLELIHALQGPPDSVVRLQLKRVADGRVETVSITRKKQLMSSAFPK
jgi:C-terminal processing protease CtpA/Prc